MPSKLRKLRFWTGIKSLKMRLGLRLAWTRCIKICLHHGSWAFKFKPLAQFTTSLVLSFLSVYKSLPEKQIVTVNFSRSKREPSYVKRKRWLTLIKYALPCLLQLGKAYFIENSCEYWILYWIILSIVLDSQTNPLCWRPLWKLRNRRYSHIELKPPVISLL